jgi:pimeloyl-ACP methyl ester carboxylesterase
MSTTASPAKTDTLKVPGATLYYEVRGAGPVLLTIPGGAMDAGGFADMAAALADRYTVVCYDPRGLSRSHLDEPATSYRIDEHADDAHRLLAALGGEPAHVLASSGGALPALELVARHPEQVRTLVVHEPPITELLPDAEVHRAEGEEIRDIYRREGTAAAMAKFMEGAGFTEDGESGQDGEGEQPAGPPMDDLGPEAQAMMARIQGNMDYFLGHMLMGMSGYLPDLDALRATPTRLVVGVGTDSEGEVAYQTAAALAERLDLGTVTFPGDHGGFASQPAAFAGGLHEVLSSQ